MPQPKGTKFEVRETAICNANLTGQFQVIFRCWDGQWSTASLDWYHAHKQIYSMYDAQTIHPLWS